MANKFNAEGLEQFMNIPKYYINQVSKFTGISQQGIRYFDIHGIVKPYKDEYGRRLYTLYDLYKLSIRSQYKSLGFSVNETEYIINYSLKDDVKSMLLLKNKQIGEQIEKLELAKIGLEKYFERLNRMEICKNRFFIRERPKCSRIPHIRNGQPIFDEETVCERITAVQYMPLVVYSFSFQPSANKQMSVFSDWDFAIDEKYAAKVGFDKMKNCFTESSRLCVYSVFVVEGLTYLNSSCLKPVFDYLDANNLKCTDTIYGNIIASFKEDDTETRYFEVYIPID